MIVPLFIPTCRALGIDLVHFGVVAVVNCMIGLITPPYGIVLFVINATTGIPLREIISEIWPFIGVLVVALVLMILFPEIVLWLPRARSAMRGLDVPTPIRRRSAAASGSA